MNERKNDYLFSNQDLFKMFIPLMIEQVLIFFVGISDSFMASSIGEEAISGVSIVDYIMQLLIYIFTALATGGAIVIGQYMGKKNYDTANKTADQTIRLILLISLAIMILVYIFKYTILYNAFGHISEQVRNYADNYITIVAISIPFMALYNSSAAIFRAMGNTKTVMKVSFLMNCINIGGNALLVYGFNMGITGLAIPTLLSRIVASIILTKMLTNKKRAVYISNINLKLDLNIIKKILSIGVPYSLENGLFQLGRILTLSIISMFGVVSVASNSVAQAIAVFQVMPGMAINLAMTTVISRCIGANDVQQAKYYNKKIIGIIYVANTIMGVLIMSLMPVILHLYNLSSNTADITFKLVLWHTIFSITIWPLAYSLPTSFRASSDVKYPMNVGILSMIFCRILLAYVLGYYFNMGIYGVWIAMFIDWIVKAALFIYRYFSRRLIRPQTV